MYFETEMYHAAAKSFVRARLATVRERSPAVARVQMNLQVPSAAIRLKSCATRLSPKRPLGKIYRAGRGDLTPPCNIADTIRVCYEINAKKSHRENLCGIYHAISASVLRDLTPRERTDPAGASGERNAW